MEKYFGSWFNHQCLDLQPSEPLLSSSGAQPPNIGKGNSFSVYMNSQTNGFLTNGDFPLFKFSALPQTNEPHNWFNRLPCFPPSLNPLPTQKLPTGAVEKKVLVFDKSDDQKVLVFDSSQNPLAAYNMVKENPGMNRNESFPSANLIDDEYVEESQREVGSEWHEDTDELNALIYCDNDYDDYLEEDDDEVTSTGRSPSSMTVNDDKPICSEETAEEEVESSVGPTKRRRLLDGDHDVLSFMHNAMTAKPYLCSELEDDAESSCNDNVEVSGLSGSKRSRKDNILKTISILQMIIPGVKGKDSMFVMDETIRCLRSLRTEAKSLGLDNL